MSENSTPRSGDPERNVTPDAAPTPQVAPQPQPQPQPMPAGQPIPTAYPAQAYQSQPTPLAPYAAPASQPRGRATSVIIGAVVGVGIFVVGGVMGFAAGRASDGGSDVRMHRGWMSDDGDRGPSLRQWRGEGMPNPMPTQRPWRDGKSGGGAPSDVSPTPSVNPGALDS